MGFLPPDTATWPSPLNGTSASVTEFKLMVAFMIPVGGHGGDQEPRLQSGPSISGSSSWDSWLCWLRTGKPGRPTPWCIQTVARGEREQAIDEQGCSPADEH